MDVDELDKDNISAALGKAELSCATLRNIPNQRMPPPPKFTYSGRICRFAQFFLLVTLPLVKTMPVNIKYFEPEINPSVSNVESINL